MTKDPLKRRVVLNEALFDQMMYLSANTFWNTPRTLKAESQQSACYSSQCLLACDQRSTLHYLEHSE
jgi:hypothetical protein